MVAAVHILACGRVTPLPRIELVAEFVGLDGLLEIWTRLK